MSRTRIDPKKVIMLSKGMSLQIDGVQRTFDLGLDEALCETIARAMGLSKNGKKTRQREVKGALVDRGVPQLVQRQLPALVQGWSSAEKWELRSIYITDLQVTGKHVDTIGIGALDQNNCVIKKKVSFDGERKQASGGNPTDEDERTTEDHHTMQNFLGIAKLREELHRILPEHHRRHNLTAQDATLASLDTGKGKQAIVQSDESSTATSEPSHRLHKMARFERPKRGGTERNDEP